MNHLSFLRLTLTYCNELPFLTCRFDVMLIRASLGERYAELAVCTDAECGLDAASVALGKRVHPLCMQLVALKFIYIHRQAKSIQELELTASDRLRQATRTPLMLLQFLHSPYYRQSQFDYFVDVINVVLVLHYSEREKVNGLQVIWD